MIILCSVLVHQKCSLSRYIWSRVWKRKQSPEALGKLNHSNTSDFYTALMNFIGFVSQYINKQVNLIHRNHDQVVTKDEWKNAV